MFHFFVAADIVEAGSHLLQADDFRATHEVLGRGAFYPLANLDWYIDKVNCRSLVTVHHQIHS